MDKDYKELAPEGTVLVAKMQAANPMQWPPASDGSFQENVQLYPVYSDQGVNKEWSEATPSGGLQLTISNPNAQGHIKQGKEYFVFIVPAN